MIAAICGSVGSGARDRTVLNASRNAAASTWSSGCPMAVVAIARSSSIWACSSGLADSGFSLTRPPGESETGFTPALAHSGPYSRLTSSTKARRPNSSMRHSSVFTSALLPWPSLPITIALGSSSAPSS